MRKLPIRGHYTNLYQKEISYQGSLHKIMSERDLLLGVTIEKDIIQGKFLSGDTIENYIKKKFSNNDQYRKLYRREKFPTCHYR